MLFRQGESNIAILKTFVGMGSGFDIVSTGELFRVIKAGGDTKKVVYSGVGKRADEIAYALKKNILMFCVESPEELREINRIAKNTQENGLRCHKDKSRR